MKKAKKDLSIWEVRKTESGWQELLDKFFINFTPKWFQFLGWLVLLGVLEYISREYSSVLISIIFALSLYLFFMFLQSIIFDFPFYRILPSKFIKNKKFSFVFSVTMAAIISLLSIFLVIEVVNQLSGVK